MTKSSSSNNNSKIEQYILGVSIYSFGEDDNEEVERQRRKWKFIWFENANDKNAESNEIERGYETNRDCVSAIASN